MLLTSTADYKETNTFSARLVQNKQQNYWTVKIEDIFIKENIQPILLMIQTFYQKINLDFSIFRTKTSENFKTETNKWIILKVSEN